MIIALVRVPFEIFDADTVELVTVPPVNSEADKVPEVNCAEVIADPVIAPCETVPALKTEPESVPPVKMEVKIEAPEIVPFESVDPSRVPPVMIEVEIPDAVIVPSVKVAPESVPLLIIGAVKVFPLTVVVPVVVTTSEPLNCKTSVDPTPKVRFPEFALFRHAIVLVPESLRVPVEAGLELTLI